MRRQPIDRGREAPDLYRAPTPLPAVALRDPLETESERSRVSRGRWQAPAVLVAALAVLVVAAAVLGKTSTSPPAPSSIVRQPIAVAPAASPTPPAALPTATVPSAGRQAGRRLPTGLPATLECVDVARARCAAIVRAALAELPDDVPAAVRAWVSGSLYCDNTLDCPPPLLESSVPLGSAVLSFADDGPQAWINVVRVGDPEAAGSVRAWLVRWTAPRPGPSS